MVKISAVIITFNEENNIERCLKSLTGIADEIIVVDSLSTDRTAELCSLYDVKFYQIPFLGYVEQKNKALEFATHPYVLSLDADEALSDELKRSVLKVKENWNADGYWFNRLTNYCGKWIRHGDWYPDRKLRLWDTRTGKWTGELIHERVQLNAGTIHKTVEGDLLHFSFPSLDHHFKVLSKFTTTMALENYKKGKRSNVFKFLGNPLWKFIKGYFIRGGFLDGYYGFVIASLSSYATFVKYLKLRELNKSNSPAG